MFEDLPPTQLKAKEVGSSAEKEESSHVSWSGFAMPPESNSSQSSTSLRFKPRFVATGVKETASKTLPAKTPKKEPQIFNATCVESDVSIKSIGMIEVPVIGNAPCDLDLNPLAFVRLFDSFDAYDPCIPHDYQKLQLVANQIQIVAEENMRRNLLATSSPQLIPRNAPDDSLFGQEFGSIRPTTRTKRTINNQPAWLDAMKKGNTSEIARPQSSSSSPLCQVLDYSTLSLTLSVVGVSKQLDAVLLHLKNLVGDFSTNLDTLFGNSDKFELVLVFKSQPSCIRSYHSLVVGQAREISMQSNEAPIVRFL